MKKTILFAILIVLIFGFNTPNEKVTINWMTFNDALKAQKTNPKKIIMDVYTNWCGPCKLMDKNTFQNKDVIKYINENFYAVKFNAEGPGTIKYDNLVFKNPSYDPKKKFQKNSSHQLTDYLQIQGFPTIVFFEEDGALLAPFPGYRTYKQLEFSLKLFGTNKYKEIKDEVQFSNYQKNFVYKFIE